MKKIFVKSLATVALVLGLCLMFSAKSDAAQARRLNLKKLNLTKTTSFTIRVYNLDSDETASFKSSDSDVLSVTGVAKNKRSCVVYGKKANESAKLKVTIKNKSGDVVEKLTCKIKVTPVPVSIKFTDKSITITEGDQVYLEAIIKPYSATENPVYEIIKIAGPDEEIVKIIANGLVTGLAPGKVKVKATLLSTGKSATCTITVKPDPDD
ncbi:MAG: Ig-like domain-containing protein [Eubacterium sp.]|nr:Ig-like domain-containing protein [Eubacterium sp.]